MMARMLSQLPLPLLPAGAAEIAPGVGLLTGDEGGLVTVHGLATFAWDAGDEAGRRLAAVQLVRLRAASQGQVAGAFGVDPGTIWRWDQALAADGVAGLVPARRGPKGASKLTPELVERIAGLDAAGATLREIAAATGVSTFSVRNALGRVASGGRPAAGAAEDSAGPDAGDDDAGQGAVVPVLPDPVPRDGERVLARWGLLGEGAAPVFTPGCPVSAGRAAAGAARAGGHRPAGGGPRGLRPAQGRVLRADRDAADAWCSWRWPGSRGPRAPPGCRRPRWAGCWAWTGRRRSRRSAASWASSPPPGKAAELIMALARRHAAARPDALGFLHVDGHARVYYGTRQVQKTHVARLKFPAPATMETWVTDQDGDPVFMVVAEPSDSLAGELRRLLPAAAAGRGPGAAGDGVL